MERLLFFNKVINSPHNLHFGCDHLKISDLSLMLCGTLDFYRKIEQNAFSVKLRKDTVTTLIIRDFQYSEKKYLLLDEYCYIGFPFFSLTLVCELKEGNSEKEGRKIPSLSKLKTKAGNYMFKGIPGVAESSSLYSLMNRLTNLDPSLLKEGNIVAITPPEKFIAQAPHHRRGFQKHPRIGNDWNYGVGHIFDIVGVIIGRQ